MLCFYTPNNTPKGPFSTNKMATTPSPTWKWKPRAAITACSFNNNPPQPRTFGIKNIPKTLAARCRWQITAPQPHKAQQAKWRSGYFKANKAPQGLVKTVLKPHLALLTSPFLCAQAPKQKP